MKLEEVKSTIGGESAPMVCEVEKGAVKRFIQATEDLKNPLWRDEEYAKTTRYGGIVVPPPFLLVLGFEQFQQQSSPLIPLFKGVLNGGTELEYYQPVRAKDTLVLTTKAVDFSERETKMGKTTFITFETKYRKQGKGLVAKCSQVFVGYY